jgi:branched-subunit amino acid aminotransferase/4-amino-4-deoxychorismate lyase
LGGTDRVHRLAVGPSGLQVSERAVGSTAPVWLVTARTVHRPYRHKITERSAFDAAAREAMEARAGDALLLTARGAVAECTIWSLLWWEGERLAAPPLGLDVLRSVSRMRLEELAGPLLERAVPREALTGRSLLVANAVRGVVPVARLDGVEVPQDARTMALATRFWP